MITPQQLYDIADNVWHHRIRSYHPDIEKDDAIQEAVLRAWKNRERFDPTVAKEVTFFSTVMRREIHQHAKVARNCRTQTVTDIMAEHLPTSQGSIYCDDPDPLTVMIMEEDRNDLQQAIDGLSRERNAVIELRMNDIPIGEIAEMFGVSHQAISTRYLRALDQIRDTLGTR